MIKLNIGLERSAKFGTSGENSLEAVCAMLDKHCAEWRDLKVEQSATEKTVIVNVAIDSLDAVKAMATELKQDCIAAFDGVKGALIGEYASEWGEFNKDYFIE